MSGYSMPAAERIKPVASIWFVAPSPSRIRIHLMPIASFANGDMELKMMTSVSGLQLLVYEALSY